nr:MAG TPA: Major capsid protein [Caudoviricetes sp.]
MAEQNQTNEPNTNTEEPKDVQTKEQTETKKEPTVDVERVKSNAVAEYLKSLGVEDSDTLKGIVTKAKEEEDKNKTDLEKSNETLTATTKELAAEREARQLADAKLAAIKLGANPKLVDDLVVIAKARATGDKKIEEVIAEIKDGETGKIYFGTDESEVEEKPEKKKQKNKNVTRKSVKEKTGETEDEDEVKEKHAGTMAARLLAGTKKKTKSSYFSN